jgi:hypothetical protein
MSSTGNVGINTKTTTTGVLTVNGKSAMLDDVIISSTTPHRVEGPRPSAKHWSFFSTAWT